MPDIEVKNYSFKELDSSPLCVGSVYQAGDPKDKLGAEPIHKLMHCQNRMGIRKVLRQDKDGKINKLPAYVVLVTSMKEELWPDKYDSSTGIFHYFGDNKKAGEPANSKAGNRLLKQVSDLVAQNKWSDVPPFFVFHKTGNNRDVRFLGLAVPGNYKLTDEPWLNNIEKEGYSNFFATFTILDTRSEPISKVWLDNLVNNHKDSLKDAPMAWRKFLTQGLKCVEPLIGADNENYLAETETDTPIPKYWKYSHLVDSLKCKKNLILQGAPGTGKSFLVPEIVTRLCGKVGEGDEDRDKVIAAYNELIKAGRVVPVTFHPSYDYENFVQGWRPDETSAGNETMKLRLVDGVFKSLCDRARELPTTQADLRPELNENPNPTVWKVSLMQARANDLRKDCMDNNRIRIGWDEYDDVAQAIKEGKEGSTALRYFMHEMKKGDIVVSCWDSGSTDAIGVIEGDYEQIPEEQDQLGYRRSRPVKWLYKGTPVNIKDLNQGYNLSQGTVYKLYRISPEAIDNLLRDLHGGEKRADPLPYVLVIDEFNRGNVANIFGELISLIEPGKREGEKEEMAVKLAYSASSTDIKDLLFTVPNNVYIVGTMNTADRSIATMDYAMRRRFIFQTLKPEDLSGSEALTKNNEYFDRDLFESVSRLFVSLKQNEHLPDQTGASLHPSEYLSDEYEPEQVWLGHSYFIMKRQEPCPNVSDNSHPATPINSRQDRWEHEIKPILLEYWRDGVLKDNARDKIVEIGNTINRG